MGEGWGVEMGRVVVVGCGSGVVEKGDECPDENPEECEHRDCPARH